MNISSATNPVAGLLGDPREFSLEHRIFNSMMLVISITGMLGTIINILGHLPFVQTMVTSQLIVVSGGAYLFSMKRRTYQRLVLPAVFYFFAILAFAWFATYGSRGSVGFFFFIFLTYSCVFFSKDIKSFLVLVILFVVLLLLGEYFYPELLVHYDSDFQQFVDIGASLVLCLVVNIFVIHSIYKEYVREREMKDSLLKQALLDKEEIEKMYKEIKILQGYLPICASCKKIRDEKGSWHQVEKYLSEHSEAKLTHGVCPDCVARLYPELNPNFSCH